MRRRSGQPFSQWPDEPCKRRPRMVVRASNSGRRVVERVAAISGSAEYCTHFVRCLLTFCQLDRMELEDDAVVAAARQAGPHSGKHQVFCAFDVDLSQVNLDQSDFIE